MQEYAHDRLDTDKRPFYKKSRTMSRLPRLALILLVVIITTTLAVQLAYAAGCDGNNNNNGQGNGNANGQGNGNANGQGNAKANGQGNAKANGQGNAKANAASTKKTKGTAAITLATTQQAVRFTTLRKQAAAITAAPTATLSRLTLSGAPQGVPLVIHIHAKNTADTSPAGLCKGPILFVIQNPPGGNAIFKTDQNGRFSIDKNNPPVFKLAPPAPGSAPAPSLDASQLDTWVVNVHNANDIGADGKPVSIACGAIKVGSDPTKGTVTLKASPASTASAANVANSVSTTQTSNKLSRVSVSDAE